MLCHIWYGKYKYDDYSSLFIKSHYTACFSFLIVQGWPNLIAHSEHFVGSNLLSVLAKYFIVQAVTIARSAMTGKTWILSFGSVLLHILFATVV